MAVTKIHRIHSTLNLAIDYVVNGGKTNEGEFVSSFSCVPEMAARQFARRREEAYTEGTALAHHLIQSFLPGEVSPEKAHQIGIELADKMLDGKYQYVIATHIDKGHIHNHIIFNSVSHITHRYYESYKKTYYQIRNLSDQLCAENGLHIIPPSPNRGQSYYEYIQTKQGTSYKAKLKETIDKLIPFCKDYEDLISKLTQQGYEIKRGKYISVRASDQERFTRIKTLGADYTEDALVSRIRSKSKPFPFKKAAKERSELIESNARIESSPGLHNWMTRENLKVIARDYANLQENYDGIENLSSMLDEVTESMETHRSELCAIEDRMKYVSTMMEYSKTYRELKPVYMKYHKAKDKDKEALHRAHESDILLFESINRQIKEMGYSKVPTFKTLKEEYDYLASEKITLNTTYQEEKKKVNELTSAKKNIDRYLSQNKRKSIGIAKCDLD